MKLATLDDGEEGALAILLPSGEYLDLKRAGELTPHLPKSLKAYLAMASAGRDRLQSLEAEIAQSSAMRSRFTEMGCIVGANHPLLAPTPSPSLIMAAGLAYRSHLKEMAGTPEPPHPTGFLKAPSSVSASGDAVTIPAGVEMLDYEGELAVVFGRHCHRTSAESALDHVAGYTLANDLSARDWVKAVWEAKEPWHARLTWEVNIMGKQFPGFTALGPVMITTDECPDPSALTFTTRVNNVELQSASVSDLIFTIPEMIAHFSQWFCFSPGDVLLTGTPAGVGISRSPPIFLGVGDEVEVSSHQIGSLRTHFSAEGRERAK